jgi:hypothetical protein
MHRISSAPCAMVVPGLLDVVQFLGHVSHHFCFLSINEILPCLFFFLKKEEEVFPGRVNFEVSMVFFNPKPAQHAVHTIPEFNARFATNQAQTSQHGPLATWSVKSKLVQEDNTKKITATNAWCMDS